jgi:hypothetical protein
MGVIFGSLEVRMLLFTSDQLRNRQGLRQETRFLLRTCAVAIAAALVLAFAADVSAGEELAASGSTDIGNCQHCLIRASLTRSFGPASSWAGDDRRPLPAATAYRLGDSAARVEYAPLDLEKTARTRAPLAIWVLSYNIKDLASTMPAPTSEEYWALLRQRRQQTIGLGALDPGIERNPTGLLALGLRISLPY